MLIRLKLPIRGKIPKKNLLKSNPIAIDVLQFIILYNDGNLNRVLFYIAVENITSPPPIALRTEGLTDQQTDIVNYRVASLQKDISLY